MRQHQRCNSTVAFRKILERAQLDDALDAVPRVRAGTRDAARDHNVPDRLMHLLRLLEVAADDKSKDDNAGQ